ncbi:Gamma-glutamyl kinase [Sulfitobacter donghicola DSW-25 = KCTC 12864 = JCM 14565]|nr:Gamma-glutamyl kinase [Sulfitobacter donghicola DSW-25 = KCTC 12864 = JCM 14565]
MFFNVCNAEMELLAVMREPISWLSSWYRYRQRPSMKGNPSSTFDVTFDEFVLAYMKGKRPPFAEVGSQLKFLERQPNGTGITHLFAYENQERLQRFLEERLSVKLDLPQQNVSPQIPVNLSPDVEQRFRKKFAEDFALYDSIPKA